MIPPFAFKDSAGRIWRVVLTCRTVIECERILSVKVLDLFNPDSETSQSLDEVDRFDVFAFVVAGELDRHRIMPVELERALKTADQVKAAWQAFHHAVLRFLPESDGKPAKKQRKEPAAESDKRSLHDSAVATIWEYAGWCGVEPWDYTLAELKEQAIHTARHAGRSATARAAAASGAVVTTPLREMPRDQLARFFKGS